MKKFKGKGQSIQIRNARKTDMPAVLGLIRELAIFEKASDAVIVTVSDLKKDGFRKTSLFKVFIAELNKEIVGMALIYSGYSTWKGKLIYLDDLIVRDKHRNKGIGKMLLDKIIQYAAMKNARVLKWQVLRWNENAIRFYKRYDNVAFDDEWVDCKMYKPLAVVPPRKRVRSKVS